MHCRLVRNAPTPNHPQKALKSDRRNFARFGPCHAAAPLRPSPHSVTDAAERSRFPAKEHLHTALSCTLRGTEPVRPPALSPCLPPPGSGRAPLRRSLPAPFPSRSPRGRGGGRGGGGGTERLPPPSPVSRRRSVTRRSYGKGKRGSGAATAVPEQSRPRPGPAGTARRFTRRHNPSTPRRSSAAPRRRGDGPRSAAAPRPSGPRAAAPAPLPAVPAAPPRPAPAAGSDAPSAGRAPRPPRTEPGAAEGRCHTERPPRGGGAAWREGRGRWRRRLRRRRAGVPHSSAVWRPAARREAARRYPRASSAQCGLGIAQRVTAFCYQRETVPGSSRESNVK